MKQYEVFGNAKWLCAGSYATNGLTNQPHEPDANGTPHFPVLRSHTSIVI